MGSISGMSLWELAFTIWTARNEILQDKQEDHPGIDPDSIDLAILEEWTIGMEPSWDYGSRTFFLGITCEELLAKPLPFCRQWLHYVQLARSISIPNPFLATDGTAL
jgi:hypothetical protein